VKPWAWKGYSDSLVRIALWWHNMGSPKPSYLCSWYYFGHFHLLFNTSLHSCNKLLISQHTGYSGHRVLLILWYLDFTRYSYVERRPIFNPKFTLVVISSLPFFMVFRIVHVDELYNSLQKSSKNYEIVSFKCRFWFPSMKLI
jgi:hypothetical protein